MADVSSQTPSDRDLASIQDARNLARLAAWRKPPWAS